jgi:hypothetical protein
MARHCAHADATPPIAYQIRVLCRRNAREASEPETGAQDQHCVEIELRVEGSPYVLAVLLAVEQKIPDRNAAVFQRRDHEFSLVRGDDAIARSLEEDYRRREAIDVVNGDRSA